MFRFDDLNPAANDYAIQVVDRLLRAALAAGASDIHLEELPGGVQVRWRVNGSLHELGCCPNGTQATLMGRVKALARLVTYRYDIPQEGRLALSGPRATAGLAATADGASPLVLEARVGTLPTLHGERAVIRLSNQEALDWLPSQLGLDPATLQQLQTTLAATSGVIMITGPAGSGKTTTAYACLRHLLQQAQRPRSLVSLEDPIEREIVGVSQSQIQPSNGYTWSDGLSALLRQDPEVMLVGEIRDPATAAVVFQAAMTGQLVISTMHARSAADAVRRLLDLQVPVHHLLSALDFLVCQRLTPARCTRCDGQTPDCPACQGSGWCGRQLLCELLPRLEGELADAVQQSAGSKEIERAAESLGMRPLATLTAGNPPHAAEDR